MIRESVAIATLPGLWTGHDLKDVWVCRLQPEIRQRISVAFCGDEKTQSGPSGPGKGLGLVS
jgi:hypothetical protein